MNTPETTAAALAAWSRGRGDEALALLRDLGPAAADDPLALQIWALALKGDGAHADALALLERAVRIAPGDPQAHFNLAVTLQAIGELPRAIAHYQAALRLDPAQLGALNNLSDLYRRRGRAAEGWALMERYQAAGGSVAGLEIRLAKLAMDLRRFDEAEVWFTRAATHAPKDPAVAWEHAMLTLAREDFVRGWAGYEARLASHGLDAIGIFGYAAPRWKGEKLRGKSLLLHREQGLGDTIMFARCFAPLAKQARQLHLAVHPQIARLMAFNVPEAKVWSSVTTAGTGRQPQQPWLQLAGAIDFQAPICSLGALNLAKGVPRIPAYLRADPDDIESWALRLDQLAPSPNGARRIGLVLGTRQVRWSDDGLTNALRKTVTASAVGTLAQARGIRWVALHDRETAAMLADVPDLDIADPSPWITDMADTAAIIENLDAVVTADTAVAHLAGAMGKRVLLMLWWNPDWRWGVDRTDSYWYPNVEVFRQKSPGDWASVLEAVAEALGSNLRG